MFHHQCYIILRHITYSILQKYSTAHRAKPSIHGFFSNPGVQGAPCLPIKEFHASGWGKNLGSSPHLLHWFIGGRFSGFLGNVTLLQFDQTVCIAFLHTCHDCMLGGVVIQLIVPDRCCYLLYYYLISHCIIFHSMVPTLLYCIIFSLGWEGPQGYTYTVCICVLYMSCIYSVYMLFYTIRKHVAKWFTKGNRNHQSSLVNSTFPLQVSFAIQKTQDFQ